MQDPEIKALLRKYRAVGPPAEMRERILAETNLAVTWAWVGAAAALLIVTSTLQLAIRATAAGAGLGLAPSSVSRVTEDLANRLGGDRRAREMAELIVLEQQVPSDVVSALGDPAIGPGGAQR